MRLVYVLEATDIGLRLLADPALEPLFGHCGFPYFILMNKLLQLKQYDSVIALFDRQLPFFTVEASSSSTSKIRTPIPFDQASILLEALMLMNSKESFEKLKHTLNVFSEKKFQLSNLLIARSFLLAVNQNEPEYALKLMYDFKFKNLDDSLARNLTVIALCRLDLVEQAFRMAENLKGLRGSLDLEDKKKFIGRFFPMTVSLLFADVVRIFL